MVTTPEGSTSSDGMRAQSPFACGYLRAHHDLLAGEESDSNVMLLPGDFLRRFVSGYLAALVETRAATKVLVRAVLQHAKASGKAGPVAEYLVGAKLSLRFPNKEIRNKRFSTSDSQAGFSGDFEIGSTTFHVTVAPMPELLEKCKGNLERESRVYLLVPDAQVVGARQNAELLAPGRIAVESIESFVATNIDELSEFDGANLKSGFRRLLEKYNDRVGEIELDKSMLIDIPPNLE